MARIDPIETNFSSGELSKLLIGRVDIAKYPNGVDTLENFLIQLQGGITRRSGTRYLAETASSAICRLLPFQYSADQDYVIAATNELFRMYSNSGSLVTDTVADTWTKLLMHFNGNDGAKEITDSGATGHVITQVGTATLSYAQAKFGICSLLLDGDSDYLTVPTHADWTYGTNPFTWESRIRFASLGAGTLHTIFNRSDVNNQLRLVHEVDTKQLSFYIYTGGVAILNFTCPFDPAIDTWYHVALVRVNSDDAATGWRIFVNGVSQTLTKASGNWNGTIAETNLPLYIGATYTAAAAYFFNGYLDEVRISDIARWSSDFTPDTTSYTSDADTLLLLHFESLDQSSVTAPKIPIFNGTAQLDTAQYKNLTGYTTTRASLLLDGNSDWVTVPDSDDWYLGTGDFTMDIHCRLAGIGAQQNLCGQYEDANNYWFFEITAANKLQIKFVDGAATKGDYITTAAIPGIAINTWFHFRVVRSGASVYMFVDGTSVAVTETTAISTNDVGNMAATLKIGAYGADAGEGRFFNGWMDEVRISKGYARTTADFTAPTAEYTLDPLVTTEISTPYQEADLFELYHAHKGDIKYITHGDYHPRKLSRTSATAFSLALAGIERGPFLDTNTTAALTITPSLDTGNAVTLTAAAPGAFHYDATDGGTTEQLQVGSLWRIKSGVVKLTAVNSATEAIGNVQAEPDGTAGDLATGPGATADWAEGAFSGYRGYPAICAFHDGRLYYACTEYEPQKIWGSCLYDYDNFLVSATPADDEAVTFEIATEERVAIRWMLSGNKALTIGSTGATFSAYGTANAAITPGDIQVTRDTNYGSALIAPKRISSFAYYVQRNLQKIRELSYYYDFDVTRAADMNMLADHILRDGGGVVDMDYQQAPTDRLWCVRDDGEIAVLTRNPEQDVMGWSRIIAGLDSTGNGKFESVVVIPKQNDDDQVWVVVNRTIGGTTKRFIEFFIPENFTDIWDAVYLDSSLTLDSPKTITGMTNASPGVFACTAHGFTTGDQVKIDGVVLSNVSGAESEDINGTYLLIEGGDADHFTLTDLDGNAINPTHAAGYGDYVSGGEARKMVTNISGLGHLEGETVQVQMDGDVPTTNSFVVTGGAITLASKAAVVHCGLPYQSYVKTMRSEGGSQLGSSQNKIKRIHKIGVRFYKTLACDLGGLDRQDSFSFDSLYTGDRSMPVPAGWETQGQLVIKSSKPLPLTVIALMPQITVSDL